MKFDLAQMARRLSPRRKDKTLRVMVPPGALRAELDAIYVAMLRGVAAYTTARILPAYSASVPARDSVADSVTTIQGQTDGLDAEIRRLVLTLTPELRRWVLRVEAWHRKRWTRNAFTATGVDLTTLTGPTDAAETLEISLARNVGLMTSLGTEARSRIADAVWRGFQSRTAPRQVAKAIDDALGLGRKRALRIAADQMQKLSAALDMERMRQAGIDHWVWRHSHKKHPRPAHQARDGKVYTDATAPDDLPGELPFCGCKAQALVTFD